MFKNQYSKSTSLSYSLGLEDKNTNYLSPKSLRLVNSKTAVMVFQSALDAVSTEVGPSATLMGSTMTTNVEAVEKSVAIIKPISVPRTLQNSASDQTTPDIKFYLGKPVRTMVGAFTTTDAPSTFGPIGVFDPIKLNTILYEKIKGNFSFRADTVVTLQVNASRFQAGRYILAYLPLGGYTLWSQEAIDIGIMKRFTATQVTQLLHVELDLATDTQVQLRIPYAIFANSTPVSNSAGVGAQYVPGVFFLYPYMALLPGSAVSTANYVVWVHYENIELFSNMAPQMGDFEPQMASFDAPRGNMAQAVSKGKDVLGMEMYKPGPVEKGANIVRKVAEEANKVPLLSVVAGPLMWVADAIGGVCSIFGWSKPLNIIPSTKVNFNYLPQLCNSDVKDNIDSLSQSIDNHIAVLPGFGGTDVDEMSIDYLKNIYAFYKTYNWTGTNSVGDNIFTIPLSPSTFMNTITDTTNPVVSASPIAFLSLLYGQYRGGLTFKIKIVKTEFHSGRLILGFFPLDMAVDGSTTAVTFDNLSYVQKTVIDVRLDNEWEFDVPFVSTTSYKSCSQLNASSAQIHPNYFGYLGCWVLSDLVYPDGVPSTIKVLVEVKGSKDLEFAVPRQLKMCPIIPLNIQAQPQMGDFDGSIDTGTIGTAQTTDSPFEDAALCTGEPVTSLRQLLKRPCTMASYYGYPTAVIAPEVITPIVNTTPGLPTYTGIAADFITLFGCMYSLTRGGTRIKLLPATPYYDSHNLVNYTWISLLKWDYGDAPNATKVPLYGIVTATSVNARAWFMKGLHSFQKMDWGIGFNIPFYSKTHSKPTAACLGSNARYAWTSGVMGQPDVTVELQVDSTEYLNAAYLRYGSDDKDFSGFTGIPPFVYCGVIPYYNP
jgi:hypothetical protein